MGCWAAVEPARSRRSGWTRPSQAHRTKLQMSRFIANNLTREEHPGLGVKRELYLLEPHWLSSSVSTLLLGTLANVQFKVPPRSGIINSFVNVQLDDDPHTRPTQFW